LSASLWIAVIAISLFFFILWMLCRFCMTQDTGAGAPGDVFYWSGTFPYDQVWRLSGYEYDPVGSACSAYFGQCCVHVCRPLAWLICTFPTMPENAWGGICGYFFLGTHQHVRTENLYRGGSPLVEFLGMRWRRRADLHEDQSWRLQVYNFLTDDAQQIGMQEKTLSWGGDLQRDDSSMTKDSTLVEGLPLLKAGIKHQVLTIGCTRAIMIHDVFMREMFVGSAWNLLKSGTCGCLAGTSSAKPALQRCCGAACPARFAV